LLVFSPGQIEKPHRKPKSVVPTENLNWALIDRKRFSEQIYLLPWSTNQLSQSFLCVISTTLSFLNQQTKLVVTTNLPVKATDKSVARTVFGRLEHTPNFPVAQQISFIGALKFHIRGCQCQKLFKRNLKSSNTVNGVPSKVECQN
jgi:hypothetical protein